MKDKPGFDPVNTLLPSRNKPVPPKNISSKRISTEHGPKKNWLARIMFFLILVLSSFVLYLFFERSQARLSSSDLIDIEEARKNLEKLDLSGNQAIREDADEKLRRRVNQ